MRHYPDHISLHFSKGGVMSRHSSRRSLQFSSTFMALAQCLALLVGTFGPLILAPIDITWAASNITVTTSTDNLTNNGDCSLREAIQAANTDTAVDACTAGSGDDTIAVPVDTYTLTLAGAGEDANATGDLDITANVTIQGVSSASTIIDGNAADRVLQVFNNATVKLDKLTVRNGNLPNGNGGAVYTNGPLTITNSVFSGNSASDGGAILAEGPVTISASTFSGNTATTAYGGAIDNSSQLTVTTTTFSNNSASNGSGSGGAIRNSFYANSATITASTFSGNTAGDGGGAIYNSSTLTVRNSTFSANTAGYHGGAAIYNDATLTLTNSTMSGNTAGHSLGGNGTLRNTYGTLYLRNTIIANTTDSVDFASCGTISANVNNLIEDGSCSPQFSGDPRLAALANNGGPTKTFALQGGSPASNAGDNATCEATDQRGTTRPQATTCDIGAFEAIPITSATASNSGPANAGSAISFTATSTGGDGPVTYSWDFGDGQTGSGATTTHTYSTGGSYTAIVTASNGAGSVTANTSVTVNGVTPTATSTPTNSPTSTPTSSPTNSPTSTTTSSPIPATNTPTATSTGTALPVTETPTTTSTGTVLPVTDTPTSTPTASPTVTSVPPISTSVPPTSTSVPPTSTSVPPTATTVPPTATTVPATVCNGSDLKTLLNGAGPVINLNGTCRYLLTDASGLNGHIINLSNKSNLTINGNGATIERDANAGALGIMILVNSSNITFKNVTFTGGKANGASNSLAGQGGGLALYSSTNVTLNGVRFVANTATIGGALVTINGTTTVYNGVFASNQAINTAAGAYVNGTTTIENSTFADVASNPKEALFVWKPLTVRNSIIVNHTVAIAAAGGSSVPVIEDYNLFSANTQNTKLYNTGTTITSVGHSRTIPDADLQFVDLAHNNYHLKASSPAIDQGVASNTTADADNLTRPFSGTQVDAGAYEFQGPAGPALAIVKSGPYWVQADTPFLYQLTVMNNGLTAATNLRVTDTLPAGVTFVGNASDGGSLSDGVVTWSIGTLAAGQMKTVSYQARTSQNVTSTTYGVSSLDNANVGTSGKALTTNVNNALLASLLTVKPQGFFPKPDGYSFPNWGGAADASDFTVKSMYMMFGSGVCTSGTAGSVNTCVLTAAAEQQRQYFLTVGEGGHCFGMAASSMAFFNGKAFPDGRTTPADFQAGAGTPFDLVRNATTQNMIDFYHVLQLTTMRNPPAGAASIVTPDGTAGSIANYLNTYGFDGPQNNDTYMLGIRRRSDNAGHAVTPYALEDKGSGIYWLYVYDNNYPGDFGRVVKLNTVAKTWMYEGAAVNPGAPPAEWEGDDSTRSIRLYSVNYFLNYPRKCTICTTGQSLRTLPAVETTAADDDSIGFAMSGEGRFVVINSAGQRTGYDKDTRTYVNQIPGATLESDYTGLGLSLPMRVNVPTTDTYSVDVMNTDTMFGNQSSVGDLNIIAPGFVASLKDLKLDAPALDPANGSTTTDTTGNDAVELTFDYAHKQLSYQASQIDTDTPDLTLAVDQIDGTSYQFTLSGVTLAQATGITMGYDTTSGHLTFSDTDVGSTQTYNLSATRILSDGSQQTYQRDNITSGIGAGADVDFGSWNGQGAPTVQIIPNRIYLPVTRHS